VPEAVGLRCTDSAEFVESAGGRYRQHIGLGEHSQHVVVVEAVEMEEWRLELLLGSDTFWNVFGSSPSGAVILRIVQRHSHVEEKGY
jgi:hypothetical protein